MKFLESIPSATLLVMNLGIGLPSVGPVAERVFLLEAARAAERFGFHSIWCTDHVVLPPERKADNPYPRSTVDWAYTAGIRWLDPVATMGVVAGATERILIGTSVLVLPYRNPVVLANEIATLDRLSEGRILLGVGAGWIDEEFDAIGVPMKERGARTDEGIELMRRLWSTAEPVSFEGRFHRFTDMAIATEPHRPGGPPIYVGGNSPAALSRVGRLADGWLGFEIYSEELPEIRSAINAAAADAGRDPDAIELTVRRGLVPPFDITNFLPTRKCLTGKPREVADEILRYRDEGVSLVEFDLAMLPAEAIQAMEWITEEIAPLLD